MARRDSSKRRAGRTPSSTTHEVIAPSASATTASTTELSGPGTTSTRAARATVRPGRWAATAALVGSTRVTMANSEVSGIRPLRRTASTAAAISSAVRGSSGWRAVGAVSVMALSSGRRVRPAKETRHRPARPVGGSVRPHAGRDEEGSVPIALSEEHEALRRSTRGWLDRHCPPAVPRVLLDADTEGLLPVWSALADQGWLGIHVAEELGGQGYGLLELAVVLEETGWSMVPGPLLPTVVVAALLAEGLAPEVAARIVPGLVDGSTPGAVAFGDRRLAMVDAGPDGSATVSGTLRPVLGAGTARWLVAPARRPDGREEWCVLEVADHDPTLTVTPVASLDPTRRVAAVEVADHRVAGERRLGPLTTARVRQVVVALLAAEQAGGARWCLETATEYAKVRVQFGRPIGQFQAVKHRLADMAVRVEQLAAVAWDAALAVEAGAPDEAALAAATAGALCLDGYATGAKDCLQLLGGIGFTWEHDLHLRLKRALADRQLLGGSGRYAVEVADLAGEGRGGRWTPTSPTRRSGGATSWHHWWPGWRPARPGPAAPVWWRPAWWPPTGRRRGGGTPRRWSRWSSTSCWRRRAWTGPTWASGRGPCPAIIACGTPEQGERWVRPTLLGELSWCQLFSEPGAGSDLANLSTRAVRATGAGGSPGRRSGPRWPPRPTWASAWSGPTPPSPSTGDHLLRRRHALAGRGRPAAAGADRRRPVQRGLPRRGVRPRRPRHRGVDRGWGIARMTLANERVSISSGATFGIGVESLVRLAGKVDPHPGDGTPHALGALVAEAHSLRLMTHRSTLRSLAGADPGPGASLRKLLGAEHEQRVQELGLTLLGEEGATLEGRAARWAPGVLATRCLTIAGGTSEVQRNVIAERILGLPHDPEPADGGAPGGG